MLMCKSEDLLEWFFIRSRDMRWDFFLLLKTVQQLHRLFFMHSSLKFSLMRA